MIQSVLLRFSIYLITLLGLLLYGNSLDNKRLPIRHIFRSVHLSYKNLFKTADSVGKFLMRTVVGVSIVLLVVFSYERSTSILGNRLSIRTFCLMSSIFTMELIAFYFIFGIPLFIFLKIELLIRTSKRKKLSYRFLISTYILCVYAFFLWYAQDAMISCGNVILAGLLISYLLNMTLLIHISMEPVSCYRCKYGGRQNFEQRHPLKIILSGALILILMIVVNLYLSVEMIAMLFDNAYTFVGNGKEANGLDLLYYTVISFTTIGYGEIVPQRIESKIMAILIAYTSVMCLVIFVSSVLAIKGNEST